MEPDDAVTPVAQRVGLPRDRVRSAIELLADGNTIPFIARYRKERTGGLDEAQLRSVEDCLREYRELRERKATVLATIVEQGKLDDALRARIEACANRAELEELYLPFRPKRRTRATLARERGLEPLAELLLAQENPGAHRDAVLAPYVDAGREVPDPTAALHGACDIVAETWAEDGDVRSWLRAELEQGNVVSRRRRGAKVASDKFELYQDHREPLRRVPSHRFLAMQRGRTEGVLTVTVEVDDERAIRQLAGRLLKNPGFVFHRELRATVDDCYRRLLFPAVESQVLAALKEAADDEAIAVFSKNLRDLLLAPPAGERAVLGIDPGFRTGCKIAVVDAVGKFLESATIYPTPPRCDAEGAASVLDGLLRRHRIELIAIGNGTASRETDAFVAAFLAARTGHGAEPGSMARILVNESGASIYSASDLARSEFPDLDLTVRGAISIARRLQDPLAELVKIDPKSIGVGQYQHDVEQTKLRRALDREVESCVNRVGVDVNTASAPLLAYVAGIGPRLGEAIVRYREERGAFRTRADLLEVPRLGQRAFQQAAGFLRIRAGAEALDASAVHPESYHVVKRMADRAGLSTSELIGNGEALRSLSPQDFVDERVGLSTVRDLLDELEKPGRDPRREFRTARFATGVEEIADLRAGMLLEGIVTNVTRFGAFVDLGVHQDGLIHVSELDRKFVRDPADVVAVGDIVKVRVLSVDIERKRIALSRKQTS